MKKICFYLALSIIGLFISCKKEVNTETSCINEQSVTPPLLSVAQTKIIGQWQLSSIISMLPTTVIPKIKLIFKNNQKVEVLKDNVLIHSDSFQIKEIRIDTFRLVEIYTTKTVFDNGDYNFIKGGLRVCDAEMFIDNGMAFDAPGYRFIKKD